MAISIKPAFALGVVSLLFITAGTVATVASFTDTGTSQITAGSGTLNASIVSPTLFYGMSPITLESLATYPGKTSVTTSTITNTGNISAKYSASLEKWDNTYFDLLANTLQVSVVIGTTTVYSGILKNLNIPTQTLTAGQTHTIKITSTLSTSSDSANFQNQGFFVNLLFKAVQ